MRWKLSKSNDPLLFIAVFAVGLLLAGGMLYRWINRASVADREQQEEFLNAAMRSFRGEFIAPILEIRATFRPIPRADTAAALDEYLANFYTQWRTNDANGALVSTLSVATIGDDGKVEYRTLDPKSGTFKQAPMPESLGIFRPRVERINTRESGHVLLYRANGFPFAVAGNRPVVVVPLMEFDGQDRGFGPWLRTQGPPSLAPPPAVFSEREEHSFAIQRHGGKPVSTVSVHRPFPGRLRGWCFLGLDLSYLKQHFLPRLVERSFGKAGLSNYQVAVLSGDPRQVVFSSEPGLSPSSFASPDGEAVLFSSFRGPDPDFHGRAWEFSLRTQPDDQRGDAAFALMRVPPRVGRRLGIFAGRRFPDGNAWVVAARNKAGSIGALVAQERRRNLALGFGVLFLLAFSMGSLVVTTHRARELARREVEFVAGVSHEFRTPLASIQSAGFNLASGVIRKSSRVQEYGELVQNEARRLTDMIEQVMSYAGIQSGGKRYELVPTQVSGIIERALAEYGPAFRGAGWQVEKRVSENLPPVLAEAPAVESAVKNLIANAMKYGGAGKWLRVTAAPVPDQDPAEIQISVEDHGPGIDPADLPHVFDPFYRGQRVLASAVPGAGLGLSIVRRHLEGHGGRVSVENMNGKGSRFTLHLPALSEPRRKAL
jgi:signal transduction histidine kinase